MGEEPREDAPTGSQLRTLTSLGAKKILTWLQHQSLPECFNESLRRSTKNCDLNIWMWGFSLQIFFFLQGSSLVKPKDNVVKHKSHLCISFQIDISVEWAHCCPTLTDLYGPEGVFHHPASGHQTNNTKFQWHKLQLYGFYLSNFKQCCSGFTREKTGWLTFPPPLKDCSTKPGWWCAAAELEVRITAFPVGHFNWNAP